MKRFLLKCVVFLVVGFVLHNGLSIWLEAGEGKASGEEGWRSVYKRVIASQRSIPGETLVVGDSVGQQLFPFGQARGSLVANGAVFMVGHYVLAFNALEQNPQLKRVVYVGVPQVVGHGLERSRAYTNFIKPFYTFDNFRHFDLPLWTSVAPHPLVLLAAFPSARHLPLSDPDLDDGVERPIGELSNLASHYIRKLHDLCLSRGVTFQMVSPPVSTAVRSETNDWQQMRQQVRAQGLEAAFGDYLDAIQYLPPDAFQDGLHLTGSRASAARRKLTPKVYGLSSTMPRRQPKRTRRKKRKRAAP